MAASQRPGRLRRMRQRLASSLLPPLWACALWWLLAASTTIAVTWKAGVVLLICLGVLKSSWLATSYLVPEEEVEGFIAWTATAFRFLVTWVAALGLALALLYIGIADARLGWISLAPLGAFFACLSCSLWGPPGRMAIFEFLAPWPIAEGIYQARARNRPLFVFVPALRALRRWSRRWPVAQELGEEWLLAKDCARAAYRDLWYSPAYGPVRRGLALTLMAPLRLRLLLSTRLGPWALGYLCRLAQAPWLQRTWPGRTANTQYRAAHQALGAARRRYAPLADWACLGGRALAYF